MSVYPENIKVHVSVYPENVKTFGDYDYGVSLSGKRQNFVSVYPENVKDFRDYDYYYHYYYYYYISFYYYYYLLLLLLLLLSFNIIINQLNYYHYLQDFLFSIKDLTSRILNNNAQDPYLS